MNKKVLILGCIIVVTFSYVFMNMPSEDLPKSTTPNKAPHVSVETGYSSLRITSNQDKDIHGLTIYINGYPEMGGYKCDSTYVLQAHGQIVVNLSDFYKGNGKRFDFEQFKVTEIWVGSFSDNYDFQEFGN